MGAERSTGKAPLWVGRGLGDQSNFDRESVRKDEEKKNQIHEAFTCPLYPVTPLSSSTYFAWDHTRTLTEGVGGRRCGRSAGTKAVPRSRERESGGSSA